MLVGDVLVLYLPELRDVPEVDHEPELSMRVSFATVLLLKVELDIDRHVCGRLLASVVLEGEEEVLVLCRGLCAETEEVEQR